MASSSVLARVGLVSAVAVILGISTLSPLLKPAPDYGRTPVVSGPPLYQTAAAMPALPERAVATEARAKPVRLTSTAVALLGFPPPRPAPDSSTTAVAPPHLPQQQPAPTAEAEASELPPPPIVAESESPPKPEKRAAAPKRPKKARIQPPPIYTRAVQMSVY